MLFRPSTQLAINATGNYGISIDASNNINFDPSKSPNSQNLPDVIKLNFAINILPTKLMSEKKSLVGDNPFFYKISATEGYDINTNLDFEFAEYLFRKNKN